MIDFRYHLVSLISVFLALAVGIILGAGPLKESIGDSLSTQVEALRTDRDNLREQAATAENNAKNQDAFLAEVGPQLVSGQLGGRTVNIIALPDAENDAVDAVEESLKAAGATVAGRVTVNETFASGTERDALAQTLRTEDPELPTDSTSATLSAALAQSLVVPNLADAEGDKARKNLLPQLAEAKVVSAEPDNLGLATLSVVIDGEDETSLPTASSSATSSEVAEQNADQRKTTEEPYVALLGALKQDSAGVVASGTAKSATNGLLTELRDGDTDVSTVDNVNLASGPIVTTLALREQLGGGSGHYGYADGADAVLPEKQTAEPAPEKDK
ncbi:copper transporter [Saxibacter everestensis]|uniref:Copper transporter n=1 Tax=Saxibacter everestensis TaxID=2909229 RepID=A0ABY8QW23_9MICO|nr:copper transporter [Brevibacteriaceae bacterium ZFBP1038]